MSPEIQRLLDLFAAELRRSPANFERGEAHFTADARTRMRDFRQALIDALIESDAATIPMSEIQNYEPRP